ncbi:TlpA family protein disulfide reductase [uncultured Polaribacter sp.]|uniref:TlpA family protein disulfide reductase n=1 Tax=uncultured Polaribacter sp. TaxID=174711 RepID=UPI002610A4D1|nr:TlpA family protein disulfide reductase [uncultured Polaribacter sp.]
MTSKNTLKLLIVKSILILLAISSCTDKKVADTKIYIKGKLSNYDQEQGLIKYDEYGLLKKTRKKNFEVDSTGQFSFSIEVEKPIKATLDFGRVMFKGNGNNRYIYVYLKPGDSIDIKADMDVLSGNDIIKNSLQLSGSGAVNSLFVNQEDYTFNSYAQRRHNNYLFIVEKDAAAYIKTVDSIRNQKLAYIKDYQSRQPLSDQLVEISKDEYRNLAVIRKMNYPSSHKNYTKGKAPILPNSYYDFVPNVKISKNLEEKGLPYLRFVHYFITNKLKLEEKKGYNQGFLNFVDQELTGRTKYIYLAYSLGVDFKAEVYNQFDEDGPYDDLTKIVADKYGHLEKMLPGKPSPVANFLGIEDKLFTSTNLFKESYTYIDLWATWCKPCIAEFPYIEKLKKQYKDKNIAFVSISMDKNKSDWVNYVKDKKLDGIQLWLDKENKKIIDDGYNITMIPRFVLLDPAGKIVSANAPRPSDEKLIKLFDELDI